MAWPEAIWFLIEPATKWWRKSISERDPQRKLWLPEGDYYIRSGFLRRYWCKRLFAQDQSSSFVIGNVYGALRRGRDQGLCPEVFELRGSTGALPKQYGLHARPR